MSIDGGYIADQVLSTFGYIFFVVFFVLQLLVERKAKYDEKQLSERQRIVTQRVNLPSKRPAAKRSALAPAAAERECGLELGVGRLDDRRATASNDKTKQSSEDDHENNKLESEDQSSTDERPGTNDNRAAQAPPPITFTRKAGASDKRILRVGPIQWAFHRIGLAMSVLGTIRSVDAYGIYGIYSFQTMCFLFYNASALEFVATIVALYFPIQLVRVFALKRPPTLLKAIGYGQAVLIMSSSNLIPALFSYYGPGGLRGIFYLASAVFLFFTVLVCSVYMYRLQKAVDGLILYHTKLDAQFQGSVHNDMPRPQPPKGSESFELAKPSLLIVSDNTDGKLTVVVENTSASPNTYPLSTDNSTAKVHPSLSPDTSSPSVLSAPFNFAGASSSRDSIIDLPFNSGALKSVSFHSVLPSIGDPSRRQRAPARVNPTVVKYRNMIRRMKTFQVLATLVCVALGAFLANNGAKHLRAPEALGNLPDPSDYASSFSFSAINLLNLFGLMLGGWYAYMPLRVLFPRG